MRRQGVASNWRIGWRMLERALGLLLTSGGWWVGLGGNSRKGALMLLVRTCVAHPREIRPADFRRGAALEFIKILEDAPAGARGVVIDVGANDGTWSRSWVKQRHHFKKANKTLSMHIFEPQPIFSARLNRTAHELGATFMPAAAWKTDGHMNFHFSTQGSTSASMLSAGSRLKSGSLKVPAVDLASYISRVVSEPSNSTVSLMKLDVEGER